MLIFVAPAGLEKMFFETGQPWDSEQGQLPEPGPEEKGKLAAIAPNFGIELG